MNIIYESEEIIDLETLLLKLVTQNPEGVRYRQIVEYKKRVLDECQKKGIKVRFYGISQNQLEDVVQTYPLLIRSHDKTYYPGVYQNQDYFNNRNSSTINEIMNSTVKKPYTKQLINEKRLEN